MFFMLGQLEGREWPLRVHCPESAVPQLKTICATCYPSEIELVERKVEWTGLPAAAIAPRELAGGVCLSTAPGIHPVPDVAFRFDFDGRSLVYSGDTAPAAAVRDLAQGAALLLHDATWSESIDGQTSPEHSSCRQAGRLAAEARVARLGLVHLNHRYLGREAELRAEAAELFDGEVLIPGDGAELEI
jgi:ribonuclease BN (tRNA processing enzyme)